jgi:hypothetical protein
VNRARFFTLLALAVIVIAFAVTWLSIPTTRAAKVPLPASLLLPGITHCLRSSDNECTSVSNGGQGYNRHLHDLKQRTVVVYGSLAAVVILVGLAFGAGRRTPFL